MPYTHLTILDGHVADGLRALQESGQPDFYAEMIGVYLTHTPDTFAQVSQAAARSDPAAYREAVHRLKSSSASMGVLRLARCCHEIEALVLNDQPGQAFAWLPHLETEYKAAVHALRQEIEHVPPCFPG